MDTAPAPTSKPTITQLEANRLVFLAGIAAEKQATAEGISQPEAATLLDAASGGIVIGKITFPPIHGGFMLMMGKVEEIARQKPVLDSQMNNLAALAFILKDPKLAWSMLRDKDAVELFVETVTEFAMELTFAELTQLMRWVATEMERLKDGGNSAGKPSAD